MPWEHAIDFGVSDNCLGTTSIKIESLNNDNSIVKADKNRCSVPFDVWKVSGHSL